MNIKVESEGKKTMVYVSGLVDIPGAEKLKQTFDQIAAKNPAEVIIDLGEASAIENSIESLRLFNQVITSRGSSVQIVNLPTRFDDFLRGDDELGY